jgi:Tol biopolymer transport system component
MRTSYKIALAAWAAALFTVLLMAPPHGRGQSAEDEKAKGAAAKAKAIAQAVELNARTITVFDRQGKAVATVGARGLYNTPVLSPDAKRIAITKADLEKEVQDLWIMDVATGSNIQLTAGKSREISATPVWSPDGSHVAFVAVRGGIYGLYRIATDGKGTEELLYQLPGVATLTDWSMDGRYLNYFSTDLGGGMLYSLPLDAAGERKPIEVLKSKTQLQGARLSPDDHFLAYVSNESGKNEVYVRPFDPKAGAGAASAGPWKISDQGGQGMAFWRKDGKELYYLAADPAIMAVEVNTTPAFEFGKPKVLFRPPEAVPVSPGTANISRDGEHVVIAVPPPQLRQLTLFDRQGKAVKTVGEPGLYVQPHLSPDGSKVAVMRNDPKTGNQDIWSFDVASGKGYAVTNDTPPDNAPVWAPDGAHVLYVSTRESYSSIYRKNWDGTGAEEFLFRYTPGAGMVLTDISLDGKFGVFHTGVLVLAPLTGGDPLTRKPIDWLRDEYDVFGGRFSPDSRYMAYLSNEANPEIADIYVRSFDASKPDAPGPGQPVRLTRNGAFGMINWRQDGKEMYYLTRDWEVMAVDISTTPSFSAGTPKVLFKLPGPLQGNPPQWKNVSADGQRFVFAMPATAPRQ